MTNDFPEQPSEQNELKALMKEFMDRWSSIDNEVDLLKQDKKDLLDEYSSKLDVKTLKAAVRTLEIEKSVKHKHTYDMMVDALRDGDFGV